MKPSVHSINLSSLITIFCLSTGCASMHSGGENVVIKEHSVSKNCELRGKVSYSQEMQSMDADSQQKLYNGIRNEAAQLGANTVLLASSGTVTEQKHRHGKNIHQVSEEPAPAQGMGEQKHYHGKNIHKIAGLHYLYGKAYWCPAG